MGVRDDAIDMVDTLGRADHLSLKFRRDVGLDSEVRAYGAARAEAFEVPESSGLVLEDIDLLLQRRGDVRWHQGFQQGVERTTAAMDRSHQVELGEYVGAMCDLVTSDLLSHVVTAAVKAQRENATRQGIVDAVVAAVKREAGALDDLAGRARRGELFS